MQPPPPRPQRKNNQLPDTIRRGGAGCNGRRGWTGESRSGKENQGGVGRDGRGLRCGCGWGLGAGTGVRRICDIYFLYFYFFWLGICYT